ncbi:hypothetical protein, partial [Methanocrinis sp.]|uniref:hypothetical protein n=1 Tax=Methanocrinis sp. TaxID=3101522 RepID=UPI003D0DC145
MDPICRGLRRLFSSFLASICAGRSQVDLRDLITEADLRLEEGRLDPALKLYRKAAGIDPGSSAVKKSAVVLGMMGRYMEAIASLDRA